MVAADSNAGHGSSNKNTNRNYSHRFSKKKRCGIIMKHENVHSQTYVSNNHEHHNSKLRDTQVEWQHVVL